MEFNYGIEYERGGQIINNDKLDTFIRYKCPICGDKMESTLLELPLKKSKLCYHCIKKYKEDGGAVASFKPYNTKVFWFC